MPVDLNRLLGTLNNSKLLKENNALYQVIKGLILSAQELTELIASSSGTINAELGRILVYGTHAERLSFTGSALAGVLILFYETDTGQLWGFTTEWDLIADAEATYATIEDETPTLVNSRQLIAGSNIAFDTTVPGQIEISASGTITGGGGLIGITYISTTGAGSYTPSTTAVNSIIVELLGAGGGGSGVASAASSQVNLGGGGGGGSWLQKRFTAGFSTATYFVGTGGAGGGAGNTNGVTGGTTAFTTGTITYFAGGGFLGVPRTSFLPPITNVSGTGGVPSTNGDISMPGYSGIGGIAPNVFVGYGGGGGASKYGPFTDAATIGVSASTAGSNGAGKGTGGSGAVSSSSGGAKAGGTGSDGLIVIYEYS